MSWFCRKTAAPANGADPPCKLLLTIKQNGRAYALPHIAAQCVGVGFYPARRSTQAVPYIEREGQSPSPTKTS